MGEKKHIDRLFQEKFKDFEAQPDAKVWDAIEKEISITESKTSPLIPVWVKVTAIASIFVVGLASLLLLNSEEKATENFVFNPNGATNNSTSNATKNSSTQNDTKDSYKTTPTNNYKKVVEENTSILKNEKKLNLTQTNENALNDNVTNQSTNKNNSSQPSNYSDKTGLTKANVSVKTNNSIKNNNSNTVKSSNSKSINGIVTSSKNNNDQTTTSSKAKNSKLASTNLSLSKNAKNRIANSSGTKNDESKSNNLIANNTNTAYNASTNGDNTSLAKPITLIAIKQPIKILLDSLINGSIVYRDAISIEEAIKANKKRLRKEELGNRWELSPQIAPVYYNSFGKGSQFGSQFSNNNKSGETNTSYGLALGYVLSKNITLRSGINKVNLSYDTDNVIVFESSNTNTQSKPLENIDFYTKPNAVGVDVISANNLAIQQVSSVLNFNAALSQRINYLEFPLEVEYKLNKNRFGLNIIGGFSTFVLENNQVVSEFDGFKTDIGESNNINDVSFSANFGVGLNYKFTKRFIYNLEPTFKYQVNGFSNTAGNFNPYIIGVYTGFSYKF